MSTIKVNKLENTATTNGGISIDNTGHVQVDGVQMPTAGPLSNRNLIINGSMAVAQRGTVVNAGNEYGGPDRYKLTKNDGAYTISQDSDAPTGFASSFKVDVTSAATSTGNQYVLLQHKMEGQNLQQLKKGTASAESFTLQFWIKSTKTGTYVVELTDTDNNRSVSKSYTVNTSNTWEHKTLTFPGDTSGAFNNDANESLSIGWWLYAGSTYTSGALQTSWGAVVAANEAVGQVNAAANTSNNINITGVQLEVGSKSTPFAHEIYSETLAKCQRYFQKLVATSNFTRMGLAGNGTMANSYATCPFVTTMRAAPSFAHSNVNNFTLEGLVNGSTATVTGLSLNVASTWNATIQVSGSGAGSPGTGGQLLGQVGAELQFDAEL